VEKIIFKKIKLKKKLKRNQKMILNAVAVPPVHAAVQDVRLSQVLD
jgi:hypothetical protein